MPAAHHHAPIPRVLSIAGTDPSGGAGIQADLKSISATGGYGMCVTTSLVAQNTQGVRSIHNPPVEFLTEQLAAVSDDVEIDAVKIGMLGSAEVTETVETWLADGPLADGLPVVLDPVMVATSGDRLLEEDAEDAIKKLCGKVTVITPNLRELAVLTGTDMAGSLDAAIETAKKWAAEHGTAVIVKGGHLTSGGADNACVRPDGRVHHVPSPRVDTPHTHGTGCSLSSALATRLGAGDSVEDALEYSTHWLHEAIVHAHKLHVGKGNGPVDHFHRLRRMEKAARTTPAQHLIAPSPWEPSQNAAPAPRIAPSGKYTQALWEATGDVWAELVDLDFIRDLRSGELRRDDFLFYLAQDAHYLNQYSKALAKVAMNSPATDAQVFWAHAAADCVEVEAALHREWLGDADEAAPSRVTAAYTDFLVARAATENYVVGAAAVLPCFWLYAEIGLYQADANGPDHPYASWLDMYGGEDFVAETSRAIELVEKALADATPRERDAAARAYLTASWHEVDFFDQASRR